MSETALQRYRATYDRAHAADDFAELARIDASWDAAIEGLEAVDADSNDDEQVAALALRLLGPGGDSV